MVFFILMKLILLEKNVSNSHQKLKCVDTDGYFYSINYNGLKKSNPKRFIKTKAVDV